MAKFRMIDTRFWSDTYIADLDPLEKLLFLYFITNQYTNLSGIYEIPLKQIALDTGIDRENLEKVFLPRFKKSGKIYYIDGWIYVKNFQKHQKASGNIQAGIQNAFKEIPKDILDKIKEIDGQRGIRGVSEVGRVVQYEHELNKSICETSAEVIAEPFSFNAYLEEMASDKRRHIQIIALYWKWRGIKFDTKKLAQEAINRDCRPAKALVDYPDKEITDTMDYIDSQKFIIKPTLETVGKYIAELKAGNI